MYESNRNRLIRSLLFPPVSRRAFLGLLGASGVMFAQERTAPLAKDVTGFLKDDNPIDLVPRLSPLPETVSAIAKPRLDLNGTWQFNPDPAPDFWKSASAEGWSKITVPGQWVLQGFNVKPRGAGAYRLRFDVPADWDGRRAKLRFDAVYSKAEVWMNGTPVGEHLGAFTPFELDVTTALLPGKENVLDVAVTSDTLSDALTVGLEMVGHPMGGIIRKVSLFALPPVNISSFHVDTVFDHEYKDATLRVLLELVNENWGNQPPPVGEWPHVDPVKDLELVFSLREYGPDGKAVEISPSTVKLSEVQKGQYISQVVEIPVKSPKKWDAEHPNLYVLTCQLKGGGHTYTTERRFGFRQGEIRAGRFLLNGQPIRLRGISRQDTHPLTGRTISLEVHKQDIEWMKYANCNNTYTCAFLPDEEMMNLCDEAGIYVMDEPGSCWLPGRSGYVGHDDHRAFPYLLQPVLEMIERDRSHPSIITWMLVDESQVGKNFLQVLKVTRGVDPSRPVHVAFDPGSRTSSWDASQSPYDLASWHYPGIPEFADAAKSERPVVFDQSVSAYFANVPEMLCDPGLHDDWGRQYAGFWEKLWATPSILGGQAFNLNDDQYLLSSGQVSGNGDWGFIDPWRRAKPDLWHIRKVHTPVKVEDAPLPLPAAGQPLQVPIENRYDFANLSEVQIEWSLGDESGVVKADVAPHAKGVLSIRPKQKDLNGKTLHLKFVRNDSVVDEYKLPIGRPQEPVVIEAGKSSKRVELAQTDETITVKGEDFEFLISRKSGQIAEAKHKGQIVLSGGPVLTVVPTEDYKMLPGFPDSRPQSYEVLNPVCTEWKATSVTATQSSGAVEIAVAGQYKDCSGNYTLLIDGDGRVKLSYRFAYAGEKTIFARQIGMVLYTSGKNDTLSWKRKGQWSVYPEDHIGRLEGSAKALPDPSLVSKAGTWMEVAYREQPTWPWHMDANELGTRDFRSTRRDIWRASLLDPAGNGITVLSNGTQHTRAFLDGDRVGLLVACYSGPAFDTLWLHGMNDLAGITPLPVKAGTEFKDTIHLSITGASA